ncbi:MAG: hypothetical protein JWR26_2830 [Pedosphaera sp.]|nr:hypothetical protein [Pedosphaera sp.]
MADYNLKQNLAKIKDKPFNFALIEGKDSSMVLVTPKPAPGKLVEDTKKECGGGKRVAKGICLKEDGQLVFATRGAPAAAWKATLKEILKEQNCSMFLPIELRQLGDNESEEVVSEEAEVEANETETEEESTAQSNQPQQNPPPPSNPPAPTQPTATPPPPPTPPAPTQPTATPPQAQQAPPPPPPPAPKPPQPAPPAPAPQPTQTAPPTPPPPPPSPLAPDAEPLFKKRYQNCLYAELKVPAAHAQLKEQLKSLMAQAKGLGDQHNFVEGNKKLNELELLLAKVPPPPAPAPKSASTAPSEPKSISLGAYIKGKVVWRDTRAAVEADLKALEQAILAASSQEQNFSEISSKVKNLHVMMNTLDATLIDKLDAALKASSPEIKEFADKQSVELVKKYTAFVNSDPLIGAIDNNPFLPVKVKQRLTATLTELGSHIS